MTLAALIRKRETRTLANDNPAKAANDGPARGEPLAGFAALSLANPTEAKTECLPDPVAEGIRRHRVAATGHELMPSLNPERTFTATIVSVRFSATAATGGQWLLNSRIADSSVCCPKTPMRTHDPFRSVDFLQSRPSQLSM